MPSRNEQLSALRARKDELMGFRNPSPAMIREVADIINQIQYILQKDQENALRNP